MIGAKSGVLLGLWIDGIGAFWEIENYLILVAFCVKIWVSIEFPQIDGFKNPSLKIDGFGQTH